MFFQKKAMPLRVSIIFLLLITSTPIAAQTSESFASTDIPPIAVKKNVRQTEDSYLKTASSETVETIKHNLISSPDNPVIYNNLGAAYARRRNFDEAIAALEKAIAFKPDFADAFYNLSIVYDHLERFADALAAIQKAAAIDPSNVIVRVEMCQLFLATDKSAEAVPCYEALIKMQSPDVKTRSFYGIALIRSKQYDKAFAVLKKNTELFPNEAVTYNALGMLYFTKKKYKQALESFNRAVEVNADFEPARYNLAITQLAVNDRASALKQYAFLKNSNSGFADALYKFIYRDKVVYAGK